MAETSGGDGDQQQSGTFRSRMESRLDVLSTQFEGLSEKVGSVPQQIADLTLLVKTFIATAPTQQSVKEGLEERVRQDVFVEVMRGINQRLERLEGTFQRLVPWISIGLAILSAVYAWSSHH